MYVQLMGTGKTTKLTNVLAAPVISVKLVVKNLDVILVLMEFICLDLNVGKIVLSLSILMIVFGNVSLVIKVVRYVQQVVKMIVLNVCLHIF